MRGHGDFQVSPTLCIHYSPENSACGCQDSAAQRACTAGPGGEAAAPLGPLGPQLKRPGSWILSLSSSLVLCKGGAHRGCIWHGA